MRYTDEKYKTQGDTIMANLFDPGKKDAHRHTCVRALLVTSLSDSVATRSFSRAVHHQSRTSRDVLQLFDLATRGLQKR
jgi:hypothetical protein